MVITVYIRGRDYEVGPLPLRTAFLPVCVIEPEVGFTRSGLDRSGLTRRRHVITKEELSESFLRSNLRLHAIQRVLLRLEVVRPLPNSS